MHKALLLQDLSQCYITMSGTETHKIDPKGLELLKEIEKELPHIKTRNEDSHGNREYEPNQMLDAKVIPLLVNLQLSVRDHTTALTLQPLDSTSI